MTWYEEKRRGGDIRSRGDDIARHNMGCDMT